MQQRQDWIMPPEDEPFAILGNKADIVGVGVADAHVPCTYGTFYWKPVIYLR